MINWDATKLENSLIQKIADRAVKLWDFEYMDIEMDITAIHLNDVELRLDDLLKADDFNFAHDVLGIRNHINRKTGKLEDCFLPRFSR